MPSGGVGVRDGGSRSRRDIGGLGPRAAQWRRENFEIGGTEGGAGVGCDYGDAGGVQSAGEGSGEVSWVGGGAVAAGGRGGGGWRALLFGGRGHLFWPRR